MNSLVFDGKRIAPELVEKLFEHYPHLESQLGELAHVTRELERLVERANAIFGDSTLKVSEAIEHTREVAFNASIPVETQPQPEHSPEVAIPPEVTEPPETETKPAKAEPQKPTSANLSPSVRNHEEVPDVAEEEPSETHGISFVVVEQNPGTLEALGKIMSRYRAKTANKQFC